MSLYEEQLNDRQRDAVMTTEGPLLILAGAGSGKTRALTYRVAHLIRDCHVEPWKVMAITFTNKAAQEMRVRIDSLVGFGADQIWVATFHASCGRILRRYADRLGFTSSFSIYDTDDQRVLMKQVLNRLELDPKVYRERALLAEISAAKNAMIGPVEFAEEAKRDYRQRKTAEVYALYQDMLAANNAMDFDDLLVKAVELLRTDEEAREYWQRRFSYICVDEYQDTNHAQFMLLKILAQKHGNLCVVGDDDQSIYRFRGADIRNILDFEEAFPGAKIIKLEQNYRSTKSILETANELIRHNRGRKDKTLWTDNDKGTKVSLWEFDTAEEEASAVIRDILQNRDRFDFGECAVLYRTNVQSRLFEERCVMMNEPYCLIGGVNFYQRKEIKDLVAYLKTIDNALDDLAVRRIVNVPARGIGQVSVGRVSDWAGEQGIGFYEAVCRAEEIPGLRTAARRLKDFSELIESFRRRKGQMTVRELVETVGEETGILAELEQEGTIEAQARLDNIRELVTKAAEFGDEPGDADALGRFLEEVSLVAEVDRLEDGDTKLTLMTLHAAKGLEFPRVYLAGMEDGLFPGIRSITSGGEDEIEEERRLCYVGITRAMKELTMTAAARRMTNGELHFSRLSRFIGEIPEEMLDRQTKGRHSVMMQVDEEQEHSGQGTYRPKPKVLTSGSAAVTLGRQFEVVKTESVDYGEGDRVRHARFGEGTVLKVEDGKKDIEVTVEFDGIGIKKMLASFAKLKKL